MALDEFIAVEHATAVARDYFGVPDPYLEMLHWHWNGARFVFRADHDGNSVVIKVFGPGLAEGESLNLQVSCLKAAQQRLPNGMVAKLLHVDTRFNAMVMQYIEGVSLAERLRRPGIKPGQRLKIAKMSGAWLREFHATEMHTHRFLPGRVEKMRARLKNLPDTLEPSERDAYNDFYEIALQLIDQAVGTKLHTGHLHGDFHAGNLIKTRAGDLVGIDFHPSHRKHIYQDILLFLNNADRRRSEEAIAPDYALGHDTKLLKGMMQGYELEFGNNPAFIAYTALSLLEEWRSNLRKEKRGTLTEDRLNRIKMRAQTLS